MLTTKQIHQNLDAEQAVLGAMIQDFGAWDAAQPLKAEHFSDKRHAKIYLAITKLISNDKDADPVAISLELGCDADDCGGLEYFNALRDCVPSTRNTGIYAEKIRCKALDRGLLCAAVDVQSIVMQDIAVQEKLDTSIQMFEALAKGNIKKEPKSIYEIALERTEFYEKLQSGEVTTSLATHISDLNQMLAGGFRESDLVILAARPSTGKTSLAQEIGLHFAQNGLPTLFLSMEMSEKQVTDRGVAALGHVDYGRLKSGKLNPDDWTKIASTLEKMGSLPFYIDDQPALTITDVKTKVRAIKGVKLVIVDYLQLMSGAGDNRNSQIEEISRGLKQIAKEKDCVVLALSQLNRQVESRQNKRPVMADLRDSGSIEQDADVILFLFPYQDCGSGIKIVGCSIAKNREGETGDFALHFDGSYQRWSNSAETLSFSSNESIKKSGLR